MYKNNSIKFYLNFLSYYKINSKFFDLTYRKCSSVDNKLFIRSISYLLFFFFSMRNLSKRYKSIRLSFATLPTRKRYFVLVKGPKGHKRGKLIYSHSYFKFIIVFEKFFPRSYYRSSLNSSKLFEAFNYFKICYSMSTNSFLTEKLRFIISNDIFFL